MGSVVRGEELEIKRRDFQDEVKLQGQIFAKCFKRCALHQVGLGLALGHGVTLSTMLKRPIESNGVSITLRINLKW